MTVATATVLVLLVLLNLLTNVWAPRAYLAVCAVGAAMLLAVGRLAGLTWTEMGLGRAAIVPGLLWGIGATAVVGVGYLAVGAVPAGRRLLHDDRAPHAWRPLLYKAALHVPLGTVLLEEVAFRGVLLGLLVALYGNVAAVAVSSALFGLWHVLPTLEAVRHSTVVATALGRRGPLRAVVGAVLFTAGAGVLFCWLRLGSGSLLAPAALHVATNSGGYLAAFLVRPGARRRQRRPQS